MRVTSYTYLVLAEPGFEHRIEHIGVGPGLKEGDAVVLKPGLTGRLAHEPARKIGTIIGPPVEGYHLGLMDGDPMPSWSPTYHLRSVVDPSASRDAAAAEYLRECCINGNTRANT